MQLPKGGCGLTTHTEHIAYYGSKKTPKDIFGENTPQLGAFYSAAMQVAPGAWELLQDLLKSWQPYALAHRWKLPDGFDAVVKVMKKAEARIEVDELEHATFTYEFYENEGVKSGLSNVANVTHSMDAWVLRSMHRRCNYDLALALKAAELIRVELVERDAGESQLSINDCPSKTAYYIERYRQSTLADVVILPWLDEYSTRFLDTEHLRALADILGGMLQYKPFELVTVHDEFRSHANNCNWVRWQYREILAEIAESNVLDDILSQIHGEPGSFNKLSFNLPAQIRGSSYALC